MKHNLIEKGLDNSMHKNTFLNIRKYEFIKKKNLMD